MRMHRSAIVLIAATIGLTGVACTSDDGGVPDEPPRPMSARLIMGEDSKSYELNGCQRDNDQSLLTSGSDLVSELLVINIVDGAGEVSLLNETETPPLLGTATSYEIDDALEFRIGGTGEDGTSQFEVWGSCAPAEDEPEEGN